jgi:hypothetical protein
MKLTAVEEKTHARAQSRALGQRRNDVGLIIDLQEIEALGLYKKFSTTAFMTTRKLSSE